MNAEILIPITLFVCIAYAIKVVIDARMRGKFLSANGSEELVRALIDSEATQRRHSSLRWGVLLVAAAIGFVTIELVGWRDITPGVVAVLLGAVGGGNLVFFALSRRIG